MTTPGASTTPPAPLRVLVVCTANRCRSPVAEVLLWKALVLHDVAAIVRSVGFLEPDRPADRTMSSVMAERGVDLRHHRSAIVGDVAFDDVDLVLTMERRHARELVVLAGTDLPVHTMKGFADVASRVPPSGDLRRWLRAVVAARQADAFAGDGRDDEIPDPIGRPAAWHRRTVDEIAEVCDRIAALLAAATR